MTNYVLNNWRIKFLIYKLDYRVVFRKQFLTQLLQLAITQIDNVSNLYIARSLSRYSMPFISRVKCLSNGLFCSVMMTN